jgi:hypothetical protein
MEQAMRRTILGPAIDGVHKGVIQGADFARSLFAIWLGPKPPTSDLKRGLLGNHPTVSGKDRS